MWTPSIGDLVFVEGYGYGEVSYIDNKNLYNHHMSPIQITLEDPYDHNHYIIRVSIKEVSIR